MKPFNLEEAKAGKKVVTRDGRAFIYCGYNENADELQKVIGWVDGLVESYGVDGNMYIGKESDDDLFMETEKKTVWANIYSLKTSAYFDADRKLYNSKEDAIASSSCNSEWKYLGTYPIEVEV